MAAPTPVGLNLFSGPDAPKEEDLYKCVHCGFCLQACPTYVETGLETESPRGRIALMKAVNEERIEITPTVFRHWDLCIQCRACEVACPSGVPYGRLIEATKAEVERYRKPRLLPRLAAAVLLKRVLPSQRSLTALIAGLRLYQRSGLRRLVRWSRILRLVSARLVSLEASAPEVPRSRFKAAGQVVSAAGERRARVALLSGCVMPLIHGPEMHAVTRVLARNGCEVVVPEGAGLLWRDQLPLRRSGYRPGARPTQRGGVSRGGRRRRGGRVGRLRHTDERVRGAARGRSRVRGRKPSG